MEPQIIDYYNHKKGHTSVNCQILGAPARRPADHRPPGRRRGRQPEAGRAARPAYLENLGTDDETDEFDISDFDMTISTSHVKVHSGSGRLDPEDIDMIVNYTGIERNAAEIMLRKNGGDPVKCIMYLPLKDSVKNDPAYPYLSEDNEVKQKNPTECHISPLNSSS